MCLHRQLYSVRTVCLLHNDAFACCSNFLYNHHRTIARRDTKHKVQDICNTDVFHNKSASAFFHAPFVMVPFYDCVSAYTNWSSILKNWRSWHWQTNEFSQEPDSDASRQNWTDGGSGGGTGDYRSRRAWQCVIVITITSERKSRNRFSCFHVLPHCYIYVLQCSMIRVVMGMGCKVLISLLYCCLIVTNQILLRLSKV